MRAPNDASAAPRVGREREEQEKKNRWAAGAAHVWISPRASDASAGPIPPPDPNRRAVGRVRGPTQRAG